MDARGEMSVVCMDEWSGRTGVAAFIEFAGPLGFLNGSGSTIAASKNKMDQGIHVYFFEQARTI